MSEAAQSSGKSILLIDKQTSWRERSHRALERAGFSVRSISDYTLPEQDDAQGDRPDLVVLGCASVGAAEHALIGQVLLRKLHLLVLSSSLPWHTMRALFRQGADDVTDKPYNADQLVATVHEAIESIAGS
jgi:DNA-binding NtrC family response regulator